MALKQEFSTNAVSLFNQYQKCISTCSATQKDKIEKITEIHLDKLYFKMFFKYREISKHKFQFKLHGLK